MHGPAPPLHIVRFGVFEVDLRAGELRKGGLKIRLQEKPFQVLETLLERPGEIVTREELQKKLWPENLRGVRPQHEYRGRRNCAKRWAIRLTIRGSSRPWRGGDIASSRR